MSFLTERCICHQQNSDLLYSQSEGTHQHTFPILFNFWVDLCFRCDSFTRCVSFFPWCRSEMCMLEFWAHQRWSGPSLPMLSVRQRCIRFPGDVSVLHGVWGLARGLSLWNSSSVRTQEVATVHTHFSERVLALQKSRILQSGFICRRKLASSLTNA